MERYQCSAKEISRFSSAPGAEVAAGTAKTEEKEML